MTQEAVDAWVNPSPKVFEAIQELIDLSNQNFTGSVTIHFQDGIVRESEKYTRKRFKKQNQREIRGRKHEWMEPHRRET